MRNKGFVPVLVVVIGVVALALLGALLVLSKSKTPKTAIPKASAIAEKPAKTARPTIAASAKPAVLMIANWHAYQNGPLRMKYPEDWIAEPIQGTAPGVLFRPNTSTSANLDQRIIVMAIPTNPIFLKALKDQAVVLHLLASSQSIAGIQGEKYSGTLANKNAGTSIAILPIPTQQTAVVAGDGNMMYYFASTYDGGSKNQNAEAILKALLGTITKTP